MKFPVLFRVFASLNILGFLALLVQTALFFSTSGIGLPAVTLSIIATIWVLLTSFLWFFGSRYSYPLLYLTALVLAGMAVAVMAGLRHQNNSIFFNVFYGAVILIYCIFLLVSCFYRPIKEWQSSEGKGIVLPLVLFGLLTGAVFAGTIILNMKLTKYLVLDVYPNADPYRNAGLVFDLRGTTETDGLVISTNYDVRELSGRLYFADNYEAKEEKDFFRVENVRFESVSNEMLTYGENLYTGEGELTLFFGCTFPPVKAKRIIFMPEGEALPSNKSFVFTALHSKKFFDGYKDRYAFVEDEVVEEYYEESYDDGDAAYYESEASAEEVIENKDSPDAIPLSVKDRDLMITDFLQELIDTYDDSRYYFNTDVPRVIIKSKAFGYYNTHQHAFRYKTKKLLYNQIGRYYPNDENDYSLNDLVWKISGKGLYLNLEDQELPFYGLNPAAIIWFKDYLMPEPGDEYMGQSAQTIYNGMFRRAMWQLATAREYFGSEEEYNQQAQAYLNASRETGFYGPGYLYKTYLEGVDQDPIFSKMYNKFPPTDNEYFYFTEEVAIGFWLRRKLDGSDAEVWETVKTILEKYDSYPFE